VKKVSGTFSSLFFRPAIGPTCLVSE
jgi:hypothetical protein